MCVWSSGDHPDGVVACNMDILLVDEKNLPVACVEKGVEREVILWDHASCP